MLFTEQIKIVDVEWKCLASIQWMFTPVSAVILWKWVWLVALLHTKIHLSFARFFPRSKVKSSVPMWSSGLTDEIISMVMCF